MTRACDAHWLVKRDNTPREVNYCPKCQAWLCEECRKNWTVRGLAFLKGIFGERAA